MHYRMIPLSLAVQMLAAIAGGEDHAALAQERVTKKISALHKTIVPPQGASKDEVDSVFGEPKLVERLSGKGKGSQADYPLHVYQLLPPGKGQQFRALLQVTYKDDVVHLVAINHACVTKGRASDPSPEELASENRLVLIDLEDINMRFQRTLRNAAWHE